MKKNVEKLAASIVKCFQSYGIKIRIRKYQICEGVERIIFRIDTKGKTKMRDISVLADDIKLRLKMGLFVPFLEDDMFCIAVAKKSAMENGLLKLLQSTAFHDSPMKIPLAIGYDIRGEMYFEDLSKIIHLLVGGATNMGKTTALICLILSIITRQAADEVNLVVFNVGASDLNAFDGIAHLSCPIVKDNGTAIAVMLELSKEMDRRIELDKNELALLPSIVCVVDEFVSLVSNIRSKDKMGAAVLSDAITNLVRRGRHAKIHMVLATQDAKIKNTNIDLGIIRARMSFACGDVKDSVSILGASGAQDLPGNGAMLLKSLGKPIRLQGANITTDEIEELVASEEYKDLLAGDDECIQKFRLIPCALDKNKAVPIGNMSAGEEQRELARVILWTLRQNEISSHKLQQQFRMGKRADALIDELAKLGIVTELFTKQPRKVIPQCAEEVPEAVMAFLFAHGVSKNDIAEAFAARNPAPDANSELPETAPECNG